VYLTTRCVCVYCSTDLKGNVQRAFARLACRSSRALNAVNDFSRHRQNVAKVALSVRNFSSSNIIFNEIVFHFDLTKPYEELRYAKNIHRRLFIKRHYLKRYVNSFARYIINACRAYGGASVFEFSYGKILIRGNDSCRRGCHFNDSTYTRR